jgi:hypothetical protein
MPSKFAEVTSRSFSPTFAPGLSDEARKAVNAAFDAMSTWRTETVNNSEKSFERVIDKMAAAARSLGWPEQIVDATRAQMEGITKTQIETMDQMMDAWEAQIKSPSSSSAILSKLKSSPNFGAAGSWPSAAVSQMAAFNPFAVYMQMAQQWQKAWADAIGFWANAGGSWRAQS